MKTFTQWYNENVEDMNPDDLRAWVAEAYMAGYDMGVAIQKEIHAKQQESNA